MTAALAAGLLLLACGPGGPERPDAGGAAAPAEEPAPAASAGAAGEAAPAGGWTAATIRDLAPRPMAELRTTPAPLPVDPAIETTMRRLAAVVDRYGADPTEPWALGHALLAHGADFALPDGSAAVDLLFSRYAEEFDAGGVPLVRFPRARGEIRVEPHRHQLLKVLAEIGVSPDRTVTVAGRPHPVADLYRGAVVDTWLVPERNHASYASPNDVPWSLEALAAWAPGHGDFAWRALDGTPMRLGGIARFALLVLHRETTPLRDAMEAGADFRKDGRGIFAYTCGGAHLLEAAGFAVARGLAPPEGRRVMEEQVALAFYRLPRELRIYDRLARTADAAARERLLEQRLKFTGHFVEVMHKLAAWGVYEPTPEQRELLAGAAQQVALVVEALARTGTFDRLVELHEADRQLYLDVVGDSAHALHGLEIATGRAGVRF